MERVEKVEFVSARAGLAATGEEQGSEAQVERVVAQLKALKVAPGVEQVPVLTAAAVEVP